MKQLRFNSNNFFKILFANKTIDKVSWMIGFSFFVLAILLYALGLTSIISISQTTVDSKYYHLFLKSGLIYALLSLWVGTHSSEWLIMAFHNKKRLLVKRKPLKILFLVSGNFIGYYFLDYLIEKFLETEETISAVLLTNEHVLNQKNQVWQAFLIIFCMLSILTFFPMVILTCWILAESHHVYFEESTIRDRIGIMAESLFCLLPFYSIPNLIVHSRNKLFLAWMVENADDQENELKVKTNWHKNANFLIWIIYWLTIALFFFWFALSMDIIVTALQALNFNNFLILLVLPSSTLFLLAFDIYKKFLFELDQKMSWWFLVFEILTLNILMMSISLSFIYKNNEQTKNQNSHWKTEMNRNSFWLIFVNTLLVYSLVITAIFLFQLFKKERLVFGDSQMILILAICGGLLFLALILNIWKTTDYKAYLDNLWWWVLIDCLTLNFLGLIFDIISKNKKNQLMNDLVWI